MESTTQAHRRVGTDYDTASTLSGLHHVRVAPDELA